MSTQQLSAHDRASPSPCISSPVTESSLFVQIDLLVCLEEERAKMEHEIGSDGRAEGQGLNPPWPEVIIRRFFSHRPLTDRPLLRFALVALQQSIADIKAGEANPEFPWALDWLNENDALFSFERVCGELELDTRNAREALALYARDVIRAHGPLHILRGLHGLHMTTQMHTRSESASELLSLANAHARGLQLPLHAAWGSLVASRRRMEAADARGLPAEGGKRPPMSAKSIDLVQRAQELVKAGKAVSDACYESRCGLSAYIRYERLQSPCALSA